MSRFYIVDELILWRFLIGARKISWGYEKLSVQENILTIDNQERPERLKSLSNWSTKTRDERSSTVNTRNLARRFLIRCHRVVSDLHYFVDDHLCRTCKLVIIIFLYRILDAVTLSTDLFLLVHTDGVAPGSFPIAFSKMTWCAKIRARCLTSYKNSLYPTGQSCLDQLGFFSIVWYW